MMMKVCFDATTSSYRMSNSLMTLGSTEFLPAFLSLVYDLTVIVYCTYELINYAMICDSPVVKAAVGG